MRAVRLFALLHVLCFLRPVACCVCLELEQVQDLILSTLASVEQAGTVFPRAPLCCVHRIVYLLRPCPPLPLRYQPWMDPSAGITTFGCLFLSCKFELDRSLFALCLRAGFQKDHVEASVNTLEFRAREFSSDADTPKYRAPAALQPWCRTPSRHPPPPLHSAL